MPSPVPTFDFLPSRTKNLGTVLKGLMGMNEPSKPKKKNLTRKQFARMSLALRKALLDQGMPIEQVNAALTDLESRVNVVQGDSGGGSTVDSLKKHQRQIEMLGE